MSDDRSALSETLVGTWLLTSRIMRTTTGERLPTHLGDDPVAVLIYDQFGNFSAQFMKRDREGGDPVEAPSGTPTANNTAASGGYDAYFGTYTVDDRRRTVTQTLVGSLNSENVGQVLTRAMEVNGDRLDIRVDTTAPDGRDAVIDLSWRRATV